MKYSLNRRNGAEGRNPQGAMLHGAPPHRSTSRKEHPMLPGLHGLDLMVIFVVILLIFGPKQLPKLGASLSKSVKEFRKSAPPPDAPQEPDEA